MSYGFLFVVVVKIYSVSHIDRVDRAQKLVGDFITLLWCIFEYMIFVVNRYHRSNKYCRVYNLHENWVVCMFVFFVCNIWILLIANWNDFRSFYEWTEIEISIMKVIEHNSWATTDKIGNHNYGLEANFSCLCWLLFFF